MHVWAILDEDEAVVRICQDFEDVLESLDIKTVLPEWPGFHDPYPYDEPLAWPTQQTSPYHGERYFLRIWDPIEETPRRLLAIRYAIYSRNAA